MSEALVSSYSILKRVTREALESFTIMKGYIIINKKLESAISGKIASIRSRAIYAAGIESFGMEGK
jgi:hypothetical protein